MYLKESLSSHIHTLKKKKWIVWQSGRNTQVSQVKILLFWSFCSLRALVLLWGADDASTTKKHYGLERRDLAHTALRTKYSSHKDFFFLFLFILMKGCKSSCLLLTCRQAWGEAEVPLGACAHCRLRGAWEEITSPHNPSPWARARSEGFNSELPDIFSSNGQAQEFFSNPLPSGLAPWFPSSGMDLICRERFID